MREIVFVDEMMRLGVKGMQMEEIMEAQRELENDPQSLEYRKFMINAGLLNRWLFLKIKGKSLGDYLIKQNVRKVAIYGMAELGERLYEELTSDGIIVRYGIDRLPEKADIRNRLPIVDAQSEYDQDIDLVIVTPMLYFDEIKELVSGKIECPVISIKELIWEV